MQEIKNEIVTYNRPNVTITPHRNNYNVCIGNENFVLKRDIDFGLITKKDGTPITQKPCLFKAGSHRILTAFGLNYISKVVDSYKDHEKGYFYYEVETTAYYNGQPVRSGLGCANTAEKTTGFASGFDMAGNMLKRAEKRSEVDLAIKLADASGWFTMDLDDTTIETKSKELLKDDDLITPKQVKRIFAIASNSEITIEKAKSLLAEWGFASTKDIRQADYDMVCEKLENYAKGHN